MSYNLVIHVTWIATGALGPFIDGGGRPLADCVDDIEVFKVWEPTLTDAELTEELPTLCKSDSEREKSSFEIVKLSRGEICMANFKPPENGASLDRFLMAMANWAIYTK